MGIFQTIAAIVFTLVLILVWAMGGWHSPHTTTVTYPFPTPKPTPSKQFTVASLNTSWFYGMGSEGPGYEPKDKKHFDDRIRTTADWLRFKHPDLVLLQEVDFDASRSHRVDQLEALSRLTELEYSAKAVSWDVNYLPFPYAPQLQWGKIVSGGGVLSKTPIASETVHLLKKPDSNFFLYNQFYLFRYLQVIDLGFGLAINLHLEAFDEPNRKEHIEALKALIAANVDRIWIIGGDFNTPELKASDFAPLIWAQDSTKTFPTTGAQIRLDHLWYNPKHLRLIRSETGSELKASDHHPILSVFEVI